MTDSPLHAAPAACENCATALQGSYCHVCGQHAHNPLNSFGHAVEEFAESFWHLDGRVFRTLKDLLVPGRIAKAYLAGHRVPYMPPLRLFVVLAVLAFFVARFAIHINVGARNDFASDTSVAAVEHDLDTRIASLEQGRAQLGQEKEPTAKKIGLAVLQSQESSLRTDAAKRIAELQGNPVADASPADSSAEDDPDSPSDEPAMLDPAEDAPSGWIARWLHSHRSVAKRNALDLKHDPDGFVRELLHSVPTALFVLVPLFAVLLKLFYLRSGRGYLEHLVVALYSQSFLMLALLAVFSLLILGQHVPAINGLLGYVQGLLWLWMAAYLWITQYRVYAQGIGKTTLKYLLLGSVYFWMVVLACLALAVMRFYRN